MTVIYWAPYITDEGKEGTAYYIDSTAHKVFLKNPFASHKSNHVVKIHNVEYLAKAVKPVSTLGIDSDTTIGEMLSKNI